MPSPHDYGIDPEHVFGGTPDDEPAKESSADYLIEATCANGHAQVIQVADELGREYAHTLAGLLDGTSPLYRYPPGPDSPIGKCGICGTPISCCVR